MGFRREAFRMCTDGLRGVERNEANFVQVVVGCWDYAESPALWEILPLCKTVHLTGQSIERKHWATNEHE